MVSTEQKEMLRLQLERAKRALALKVRQIELRRQRADNFSKLLLATEDDTEEGRLWRNEHQINAEMLETDANLLELELEEFTQVVSILEAQYQAVSSGIVLPQGSLGVKGKH